MALWDILKTDWTSIISSITGLDKVKQMILDQIEKPVKQMVADVRGGKWKGKGADAFVQHMDGVMLPSSGQQIKFMETLGSNLANAMRIMEQASEEATRKANAFATLFDEI